MGQLRDRMQGDLKLAGLRLQTAEKYLCTAHNFVAYYMRPPTELGAEDVRRFLLHLTEERKLKAGTIKTYLGGIRFLYAVTLGRPEVVPDSNSLDRATRSPTSLARARSRLCWATSTASVTGRSSWPPTGRGFGSARRAAWVSGTSTAAAA